MWNESACHLNRFQIPTGHAELEGHWLTGMRNMDMARTTKNIYTFFITIHIHKWTSDTVTRCSTVTGTTRIIWECRDAGGTWTLRCKMVCIAFAAWVSEMLHSYPLYKSFLLTLTIYILTQCLFKERKHTCSPCALQLNPIQFSIAYFAFLLICVSTILEITPNTWWGLVP